MVNGRMDDGGTQKINICTSLSLGQQQRWVGGLIMAPIHALESPFVVSWSDSKLFVGRPLWP